MASVSSKRPPVFGRVDSDGRLVAADPALEALQRDAGSALGQTLAIPQIAAVVELARRLGAPVARPAMAASAENDFDLWVSATPEGEEIALSVEGWGIRPPAGPRLAAILGGAGDAAAASTRNEWTADEELRVIALSADLADLLGVEPSQASGAPLTRILRLEESDSGEMPLISALAARRAFSRQRARSRSDENCVLLLSGEVVTAADGSFAGFRGSAEPESAAALASSGRPAVFDEALDELLRSPVDKIIESAERIGTRAEGPLRSDYASYGNDIASAARHLLSVLHAAGDESAQAQDVVDLSVLAAEAVIMLDSSAEDGGVSIELDAAEPLRARGQERGVIQILVNLMVNAIRHSPEGGTVRLAFTRTAATASVTVSDQGSGIAPGDEQRIFERFERGDVSESGTGLGLAISRRLARSMGGDVSLDSAPGEGARFTLTLPAA